MFMTSPLCAMDNYYKFIPAKRRPEDARASGEAVKFAASFFTPEYLQYQKDAISAAISGNTGELEKIRSLRRELADKFPVKNARELFISKKLRLKIYYPKSNAGKGSKIIIYMHGGGWTLNSPESCSRICGDFSKTAGALVVAPAYRLAPEHPYPAANDDCLNAYLWAASNAESLGGNPERIYLCGDSAGGHLAFSTAIALRNAGCAAPKPAGIIAFYPAIDLSGPKGKSYKLFGEGFCLNSELMRLFIKSYAPNRRAAKMASLAGANLSDMPRSLILISECDILRDEAENFSLRLANSGNFVRSVVLKGATHMYITQPDMAKAYGRALRESVKFMEMQP